MKLYTDSLEYENIQSIEFKNIENHNQTGEYHFHSQFEIIYCLEGTAKIELFFGSINLCEGECIIIPPYKIHSIKYTDFKGILLAFKKSYIAKNYKSNIAKNLISPFCSNDFLKLNSACAIDAIRSVIKNIEKPDFGYSFLYIADLLMMFKENGKVDAPVCTSENVLLNKMLNYINEHLKDDLSISSLSGEFSVTEFHICRVFKKMLNTTPVTYITNLRMAKACSMLVNTDTDIKKISEMSGFRSHTYFHNIFKENFNVTPARYRLERK